MTLNERLALQRNFKWQNERNETLVDSNARIQQLCILLVRDTRCYMKPSQTTPVPELLYHSLRTFSLNAAFLVSHCKCIV